MIFKHRFFTVLLGVLFATVLTDQAFPLYDPGVGRFCSRDPIGYVDGNNLQSANFNLSWTDPQGTQVVIDIEASRPKAFDAPCGGEGKLSKKWLFKLVNNNSNGWLIQKVTVTCNLGKCKSGKLKLRTTCGNEFHKWCDCETDEQKDSYSYYEAWRVLANNPRPVNPKASGNEPGSDKASYKLIVNTCANLTQEGELRFFADGDPQVGDLSQNPAWKPRPRSFWGTLGPCKTTAGFLNTHAEMPIPAAWERGKPLATAKRKMEFNWRCCMCDDDEKDRRGTGIATP